VDESDREGEHARDSGVLTFAIRFVHARRFATPVEPRHPLRLSSCLRVFVRSRGLRRLRQRSWSDPHLHAAAAQVFSASI